MPLLPPFSLASESRLLAEAILGAMAFPFCNRVLLAGCLLAVAGGRLYAQAAKTDGVSAQTLAWTMQDSGTTAGLRGIYSVDSKVAWASGTDGTVLKTVDGGVHWTKCAVPDAATDGATLDFRGVQAWFDFNEAVVMASGPGDKSRIYRTTDGCKSWSLEATNLEKNGFWDAILYVSWHYFGDPVMPDSAVVLGDPIGGRFDVRRYPSPYGVGREVSAKSWQADSKACNAKDGEALFAASNSSAALTNNWKFVIGTGGKSGAYLLIPEIKETGKKANPCQRITVPMAGGSDSSGIFSLAFRDEIHGIAVGGDYAKPNESSGTAASTNDGGLHWIASEKPPHGYRSSVAWSEDLRVWIAAGTNGSDISRDDGKTWQAVDDGNWNALSLPFVVGPKGRIARLSVAAGK